MNSRILPLNNQAVSETGQCVIYVMSRDQRVQDNHALLRAKQIATENKLPLVVVFNLLSKSGDRSQEHYQFMLAGLRQVELELGKLNIEFVLFFEDHASQLLEKLNELKPAALVFDFSPLNGPKQIKDYIAKNATCSVEVVDTHNIIPTWVASEHEEFAAHTFRRKVHLHLISWLEEPAKLQKHSFKLKSALTPNWSLADKIAQKIKPNGTHIGQISGSAAGL
ncbi:MAG: deoxyribodipyrimidine photo-lyase, partial [Patescibacteria group bacterium]|nr:deoxyribodipyrimidine photo-lyase [Patescibacteria group bacterium]